KSFHAPDAVSLHPTERQPMDSPKSENVEGGPSDPPPDGESRERGVTRGNCALGFRLGSTERDPGVLGRTTPSGKRLRGRGDLGVVSDRLPSVEAASDRSGGLCLQLRLCSRAPETRLRRRGAETTGGSQGNPMVRPRPVRPARDRVPTVPRASRQGAKELATIGSGLRSCGTRERRISLRLTAWRPFSCTSGVGDPQNRTLG